MSGETAIAGAARNAVHDRDARSVLELTDDLVTEHAPGSERPSFSTSEPQRPHARTRTSAPGAGRLRQIGELGQPVGVENDRAHRPIVGGARGGTVRD